RRQDRDKGLANEPGLRVERLDHDDAGAGTNEKAPGARIRRGGDKARAGLRTRLPAEIGGLGHIHRCTGKECRDGYEWDAEADQYMWRTSDLEPRRICRCDPILKGFECR